MQVGFEDIQNNSPYCCAKFLSLTSKPTVEDLAETFTVFALALIIAGQSPVEKL